MLFCENAFTFHKCIIDLQIWWIPMMQLSSPLSYQAIPSLIKNYYLASSSLIACPGFPDPGIVYLILALHLGIVDILRYSINLNTFP